MKKKRLRWGILIMAVTLATISGQAIKSADAAILVHDENNILQNAKTAIHTATTAANTARQVALAVQNLASMSAEGLVAHYLGVSEELGELIAVADEYKGLLNSAQTTEEVWRRSFQDVDDLLDGGTSVLKYHEDRQTNLRALEQTYQDSYRAARTIGNIERRTRELEEAISRSVGAIGTKEAVQANSQISAIQAAEAIKTNEAIAQLTTVTAARYAKENQEEAAAIAINQASADELHRHVLDGKNAETAVPAWQQMYPPALQKYYEN